MPLRQDQELHARALLTLNLAAGDQLKSMAPSLHKLLRAAVGPRSSKLDRARRAWFKKYGGDAINESALDFWRSQTGKLVPDPAYCDHEMCVEWLLAARELDEACGDAILREWAKPHAQKRNLWKAVRDRGLPVPDGVREPR